MRTRKEGRMRTKMRTRRNLPVPLLLGTAAVPIRVGGGSVTAGS